MPTIRSMIDNGHESVKVKPIVKQIKTRVPYKL
jgi:hypothetical protein